MDKFLKTYNPPKLNQEEIKNISRPILSNETDLVIKNLTENKSPGPDGCTREFFQTVKEELTPTYCKLFHK